MSLGRQAKVLSKAQIATTLLYLDGKTNSQRNKVVFLLSVKGGLRTKEIAELKWGYLHSVHLVREAPPTQTHRYGYSRWQSRIYTERSNSTSSQAIVNMFQRWYHDIGLLGCSSHSGRRTFITNAARKISTVGGSLRDIQMMVGHASLQTTQRYIESASESQMKVVNLI